MTPSGDDDIKKKGIGTDEETKLYEHDRAKHGGTNRTPEPDRKAQDDETRQKDRDDEDQ
jgi:hypothetical protein